MWLPEGWNGQGHIPFAPWSISGNSMEAESDNLVVGEPWGKGPASPILRGQLETMCCPWLHKTSQSCCLLLLVKVPWQRK